MTGDKNMRKRDILMALVFFIAIAASHTVMAQQSNGGGGTSMSIGATVPPMIEVEVEDAQASGGKIVVSPPKLHLRGSGEDYKILPGDDATASCSVKVTSNVDYWLNIVAANNGFMYSESTPSKKLANGMRLKMGNVVIPLTSSSQLITTGSGGKMVRYPATFAQEFLPSDPSAADYTLSMTFTTTATG